ncbi:MAG: hypothetical protein ABI461_17080, partial [Polyangiaceae bacterium]
MKRSKFLPNLALIAMATGLGSMLVGVILHVIYNKPSPLLQLPVPELGAILLAFASWGVMFLAVIAIVVGIFVRGNANAALRKSGRVANAEVLAVRDTGQTINQNPVVSIKLMVQPEEGASFEAVAEDAISRLEVAKIWPGQKVSVRYDPKTKEVALAR